VLEFVPRPDVRHIALSETWIKEENLKLFPIENYIPYLAAIMGGRKSGGVIYYEKNTLPIKSSEVVSVDGSNGLKLKIQKGGKNKKTENDVITMYLLYRNCTADRHHFIDSLERELQKEIGSQIVILGDININLLDEMESAEYLDMFMSQGCLSLQNFPTRGQNCLDHVITNIKESTNRQ